jgi:hypothetical protein
MDDDDDAYGEWGDVDVLAAQREWGDYLIETGRIYQ